MWDSNPRMSVTHRRFSKPFHSTTLAILRIVRLLLNYQPCLLGNYRPSKLHDRGDTETCASSFQQPFSFFVGNPQLQHQQVATLRMVPVTGLEPVRAIHRILIPARLPIPPHRCIRLCKMRHWQGAVLPARTLFPSESNRIAHFASLCPFLSATSCNFKTSIGAPSVVSYMTQPHSNHSFVL